METAPFPAAEAAGYPHLHPTGVEQIGEHRGTGMDDSAADAMPAHRAAPDQGRADGGEVVTGGGIPEDRGRSTDPAGDAGPEPTASAGTPDPAATASDEDDRRPAAATPPAGRDVMSRQAAASGAEAEAVVSASGRSAPTPSPRVPEPPAAEAARVAPAAASTAPGLVGAASSPRGDSAPADSRPRTPADAWPAAHEVVGIPGPRVGAPTHPYAPGNPPGPVPGAYAWVPGPRVSGPVPYRRPNDTFGLWPHAVIDPRRDRQTPAIVVSSLVACLVVVLLLVAFVRPLQSGEAGAIADVGTAPTAPATPPGHEPGPKNPAKPSTSPDTGKPPTLNGSTASPAVKSTVLTRTQALAAARGPALRANDLAAFTGGLDNNAKELVDTQSRLFDNLRKLPLDKADWTAGRVTDARAQGAGNGGWPIVANVDVAFVHQINNADVRPVAEHYLWTVRCISDADPCTVTAVNGAPDSNLTGPAGYPAPWDLWELAVERRPHVLVVGPADLAADLTSRADEAEDAALYDLARWTGMPGTSPGFVVALTRERADFDRIYSGESAGDWAAGFALPLVSDGDADVVGGSRVVIDLDEMDSEPDFARVILRHELVHALLDPLTQAAYDRIPLWAAEGFADWLAQSDHAITDTYDARAARQLIRDGKFTGSLPTDADFDANDEDVIDNAYVLGHLAIRFLADTYGPDKACAFITDVYRGTSRSMDEAVRAATGSSLADFQSAWSDWMRRTFG